MLTHGDGNVLYFFAQDVSGKSECKGDCIANWPVLDAEQVGVGAGLDAADFSHIKRTDGSIQTTYKGWPPYYSGDNQPRDIAEDSVDGVWFVASPDYSLMVTSGQLVGADGKNYQDDYTEGWAPLYILPIGRNKFN